MTAKTIMVQGTGSSVGKSLLATALCRIFRQDGYSVAPFKAQNMSLNSYVTLDGAEIGRAQVVQAEAAGVLPTADMNPVLLKPEADHRSQLIVMGKPVGTLESRVFNQRKEGLWDAVTGALDRLRSEFDVVVIEGAGSPAEINLRQGDIVNMEVALYANAPVLLVGDIDKGGIFASVYGTVLLLAQNERELVRGVIVNKFRGDISILEPGLRQLEALTDVPVLGVVPYFRDIYIPEEDSPASRNITEYSGVTPLIDIAVLALPHISNFDDFDPLSREEGVGVRYVRTEDELGAPDLIIVPGTKTTVADLAYLRETGIADRLQSMDTGKTAIIGICGGYQMLGRWIFDLERVESDEEKTPGLGLLPVVTRFAPHKQTHQVSGRVTADYGLLEEAAGLPFEGYEIHMGVTVGDTDAAIDTPFRLKRSERSRDAGDGAISGDGWVLGTYVHGIFHSTELRRSILSRIAARRGISLQFKEDAFSQSREYDKLANLVRSSLDMDALYKIAGLPNG
ncbi:MAG: cobyric acid synthase [Chloroflexi bacterium]|nr:cobyric acid synthase [Chloroflexota bacterium]